jgi:predicted aldo/keto reductase-like oxidoreductase
MIKNLFLLLNFVDSSNNDFIELNCQFIDWWNQANASQLCEQQNKVDVSWFAK